MHYGWNNSTIVSAGELNGILNVLLALLETGDEILLTDPIYSGLVNRDRLADGVPAFAPYSIEDGVWRLDHEQSRKTVTSKTKVLLMSPSMPKGAVCTACQATDAWIPHDRAMERILFDGPEQIHPTPFPCMAEPTNSVDAVLQENRMTGWRIG